MTLKTAAKVWLTVVTPSSRMVCKVRSWLSHLMELWLRPSGKWPDTPDWNSYGNCLPSLPLLFYLRCGLELLLLAVLSRLG